MAHRISKLVICINNYLEYCDMIKIAIYCPALAVMYTHAASICVITYSPIHTFFAHLQIGM